MNYFNIDNDLNLQRGLMDPLNGVPPQYIINLQPSDAKLKQNKNQQFIEGPDVQAFGGYQIPNVENEKEYLTKIINKNDEMKQMDSTLFGGAQDYFGVMDPDLENRLLKEDMENKKMNYMGLDASDYIGDLHDGEMNLYRYINQVSLVDTDNQTNNVLNAIKALNSGTHRLKSARGIPPETLELFENILLNPDSTDNEKSREFMRYAPDYASNINDFLQKNNTNTTDQYINNNNTQFDEPQSPPVQPSNSTNQINEIKEFLKTAGYDVDKTLKNYTDYAEKLGINITGIDENFKNWVQREGMKYLKKEGMKRVKKMLKEGL